MKTFIVTDARVNKIGNKYYTENTFYSILERYSLKFKEITLMTRIKEVEEVPRNFCDITDLCCKFIAVDSIKNILLGKYNKIIKNLLSENQLLIARVPSLVSFKVANQARKMKKVYLTESMGCAWDAYWNHGISGKILAPYVFLQMKRIVRNANYATYVTQEFLQRRYPCMKESIGVSNVSIKNIEKAREYDKNNKRDLTFLTAAAVNVKYKGQRLMIRAMKKLKKDNINITYLLAGKGDNSYLKKVAQKNNMAEKVIFLGALPHEELLEKMKNIDVYIQPSLQEGLPRALIEAMSCGCVCLGSTTAGIPELLNSKYIFKRGKVNSIVKAVHNILNEDWNKISEENINKAENYVEEKLNKKRFEYYDKIISEII